MAMTPATIVRNRPRLPFTFAGVVGSFLDGEHKPKPRAQYTKCIAKQDDGSPCNLPARYVDMKLGGHVCFDHRPESRKAVPV